MTGTRQLRVLHVINRLYPGGAEALLYRLATSPGANHVVVSLEERDSYSALLEEAGIETHHLDMRSAASAASGLARLKSIARQSRADVIQCWLYRSNLLGGIAGRAAGIPVVWGIHSSSLEPLSAGSRALAYLTGALARFVADFTVYCSKRSVEVHAPLGYGRVPSAVVYNGYDAGVFRPDETDRREVRRSLGISEDSFVIGSISRWISYKAVPDLLKALRIALDRGAAARCVLVGRGLTAANDELTREIAASGCGLEVLRLGERPDIPRLARAFDLHVLSSLTEAFPNVVAETMLSGVPNVATDVGDSRQMLGDTGWVVQPGSPDDLADGIADAWSEWKSDPETWRRRCGAARDRIASQFSHDRMVRDYLRIWEEVASSRAAGGR